MSKYKRRAPIGPILAILLLGTLLSRCHPHAKRTTRPTTQQESAEAARGEENNAPFGLASPGGSKNDYILPNAFFVTSYNNSKGGPNWVAWKLVASDIGEAPRLPFFAAELPERMRAVKPEDYTGSGFDRGHQCNHEDRSSSNEASKATFVMSNMLPQAPNLNRKTWVNLENYCRKLAKRGRTLYIVCGGAGTGGTGEKGPSETIRGINVPANCWKVVLDTDGTTTPNNSWKMFGVWMPNQQDIDQNWTKYCVPVAEIEGKTGLTFFPNLGGAIQELKDTTREAK